MNVCSFLFANKKFIKKNTRWQASTPSFIQNNEHKKANPPVHGDKKKIVIRKWVPAIYSEKLSKDNFLANKNFIDRLLFCKYYLLSPNIKKRKQHDRLKMADGFQMLYVIFCHLMMMIYFIHLLLFLQISNEDSYRFSSAATRAPYTMASGMHVGWMMAKVVTSARADVFL